jgi:hypothetical protein
MDEEPDGLGRVRRQWEHLRIARERAENETPTAGGLRGPVRRAAAWGMSLAFTWMQLSIGTLSLYSFGTHPISGSQSPVESSYG